MKDPTDLDYFTLTDAAALLGKKTDTLKKWFGNGCPHKKNGTTYEVRIRDVFDWRLNYERELMAGGDGSGGAILNLEQERAKLARAQTIGVEMANAVRRGELVPAVDVDRSWAGLVGACTVKLRSIGTKIVARISVPNPRMVAARIDAEIDTALRELSANGDIDPTSEDWKRFEPPPDLKVSEWACERRKLSPESSAEPGAFDMDVTPFMREIVDSFNEPEVEETAVKKSAQVGYSENLNNVIGYIVDINPAPTVMMQPTLEMAESYSKDRIAPMIRDTPALAAKIDDRSRTSGNTILHKVFPGGLLQLVGANAPASLASRPMCYRLGDEPDRWPASAGKEGDPWGLLGKRQITFIRRKSFIGGTPTVKGASRIDKAYERGDKRLYHVPCPRCGDHISLERERFDTSPDSQNYAQYQCQACDGWILEHERFDMIRDGPAGGTARWVASVPNDGRLRSYFIWAAYSPFISWREIFDEYNEAQGDPEQEQVVHNTLFGESYEFAIVDLDHDALFRSREDYDGQRLPSAVMVITAGIDTQPDRFELEVVGWGAAEESWSIEYCTIEGDPDLPETRKKLDDFLSGAAFLREDGREMVISAAFVDSGGHNADAVYKFTRGKGYRHIYPCKGSSVPGQPIFARFSPQKKERVKLAIVGTDTAKEVIYSRLARDSEASGRCHFPLDYSLEYFKGLTSEEKVITWTKGGPVVRFVKRKPKTKGERKARNEPLDTRVYALAALRSLPMALRRIRRAERVKIEVPPDDPEAQTEAEEAVPDRDTPPMPVKPTAPPAPTHKRPPRPRRRGGGWSVT